MRFLSRIFIPILLAASLHGAIEVSARFDPPRVAAGDAALYIVEITESDTGSMPKSERVSQIPIPGVEGLSFRNGRISSSQRTNIVNMSAEYQVSQQLIFDAVPSSKGEYRVPAFQFTYKGQPLAVPAADLLVVERGADAGPSVDEMIYLEAPLPDTLYVGQSVEIAVTLYVSDTVRLQDLGGFERRGDAFSVSELPSEAQRGTAVRNGRRYTTYTWPFKVTPLSAGEQSLGFRFEVIANLPDSANPAARPADPFGIRGFGGFFDDIMVRPQRFNLFTEDHSIEVKPLPAAGRPDSFTGAIGDFSMQVSADSEQTTVGEPVMLSVKLSGTGNFSRIGAPKAGGEGDWRSYNPDEHFEAADTLGMEGSKRFDYVMIPKRSGELELPAVRFSFFDPEEDSYIELSSPPIPVSVSPSTNAAPAPAPLQPSAQDIAVPDLPRAAAPANALFALDHSANPGRHPAKSLLASSTFRIANGLALPALLATAAILRRRHRLRSDGRHALAHAAGRELKQAVAEANRCAAANDAHGFYRAAQQAVRLAATRRLSRNLRTATLGELAVYFDELKLSDGARECIRNLYTQGDSLRFAPGQSEAGLGGAREALRKALRSL